MRVIEGDERTFEAMLSPTEGLPMEYIEKIHTEALGKLHDSYKYLVDKTKDLAASVNNSLSIIRAKLKLSDTEKLVGQDQIQILPYDRLHTANIATARVIMAEPTIRRLYQTNRCDGFYGFYYDYEEDHIGDDHIDYQYLMDGVKNNDDPDGDEDDCWVIKFYSNDVIEEMENISPLDQIAAMEIWRQVKIAISKGIDPTNPDGGEL